MDSGDADIVQAVDRVTHHRSRFQRLFRHRQVRGAGADHHQDWNDEEERREEAADYFGRYQEVFEDALHEADAREKQGFENQFEFAVFGMIQEIIKSSDKSKEISNLIYEKTIPRMIIDWKDKQTPQDMMKEDWYDILQKNGIDTDKIEKLMDEILTLARRLL